MKPRENETKEEFRQRVDGFIKQYRQIDNLKDQDNDELRRKIKREHLDKRHKFYQNMKEHREKRMYGNQQK